MASWRGGHPKEVDIEKACIGYLLRRGWLAWKSHTIGVYDPIKKIYRRPSKYMFQGASDCIAIKKGRVLFVEFKTKTGRQSDAQKNFQTSVEAQGCTYLLIRSLAELVDGLERIENEFFKEAQ